MDVLVLDESLEYVFSNYIVYQFCKYIDHMQIQHRHALILYGILICLPVLFYIHTIYRGIWIHLYGAR